MKLKHYTPKWWENKAVKQEIILSDKKILLLELDKNYHLEEEGHKNLIAIDQLNNIIWIAELPTKPYDLYYDIWLENNILFAKSSNSYIAEINDHNGKITKKYMVK